MPKKPATSTAPALPEGQTPWSLDLEARRERARQLGKRNITHGLSRSPTWISWRSMRKRCLDLKHEAYPRYGGRGIKICERWQSSFERFLEDMGERPLSPSPGNVRRYMTLERRDVNGHYEPANCYWATYAVQGVNRRNTIRITVDGVTKLLSEWARETGLSEGTIKSRLRSGWTERESILGISDEQRIQHFRDGYLKIPAAKRSEIARAGQRGLQQKRVHAN